MCIYIFGLVNVFYHAGTDNICLVTVNLLCKTFVGNGLLCICKFDLEHRRLKVWDATAEPAVD